MRATVESMRDAFKNMVKSQNFDRVLGKVGRADESLLPQGGGK